jgi:hypothetical protein
MVELIIIKIPLTNNKMQMVMLLNQSSSSVGVREEAVGVTSAKVVAGTSVKAGEVAA